MIKCPHCGSSAQVRKYDGDISFEGYNKEDICITRNYICMGCDEYFDTEQYYHADNGECVCEEEDE